MTFSFRGQLSLFAHAVLRVLQDFLIGGSFANYLDQNFSTSWLRRCLWLSFSPTVYGNGSDFVSADTCALYLRAYILSSARPFVVTFFTSRALPLFQLVALGVHKNFLLASLYPDLLIDMSSSTASIASVSTLHQFRGGRVSKLLRSAIAESFSQFTKNVLLRRSDRMYCTRRVPSMYREYCTVFKSDILLSLYTRISQNAIFEIPFNIPFAHKTEPESTA